MEHTAKNFALQLGAVIALYVSIGSLLSLLFGVITVAFPDAADSYYVYEGASDQIRFSIAILIVFFPTYAILTRIVNKIRRKEQAEYLKFTKWLIYLSLLVGGVVILGDLVSIVYTYLNGDIAIRFILKALAVLVVVGAAFLYYFLDARGYWQTNESKSIQYGIGATILVIAAVVIGFMHTETPSQVREMRIDEEQLTDLQDMQWRIIDYYQLNDTLPEEIADVYNGIEPPTAPEGREAYTYNTLDQTHFELCASFAHESQPNPYSIARPVMMENVVIKNPDNWDHGTGHWCFERVLTDPNS